MAKEGHAPTNGPGNILHRLGQGDPVKIGRHRVELADGGLTEYECRRCGEVRPALSTFDRFACVGGGR